MPLLLGSDEIEPGDPPQYFNAGFMLDTGGATAAVYRKMHLVPFGEYVPFQQLLFFVGPLVEAVAAFSAGTRVTMLPVEGPHGQHGDLLRGDLSGAKREAVLKAARC